MSTKSTIKYFGEDGHGFHLYESSFDKYGPDPDNAPVYLMLRGVEFSSSSTSSDGEIEVEIPRKWAAELGLLTSSDKK